MADIRLTAISNSLAETYGCIKFTGTGPIMRGEGQGNFVCGQCNHVIGAAMDAPPNFLNAAAWCNACNTCLNLTKPSRYSKPVGMLKDITDTSPPATLFSSNNIWARHPELGPKLLMASDSLIEDWYSFQTPVPRLLYHYTSGPGLIGILQSGTMWASDLAYLNDASEMQYALDILSEVFEDIENTGDDIAKELLRRGSLSSTPLTASTGFYVSCFCTDDDLLSQWRAYGGGLDGYSIAFDAHKLFTPTVRVRKVLYDPVAQRKLIIDTVKKVVDLFRQFSDGKTVANLDQDQSLPAMSAFLHDHIRDFIYSFKHPSFHEEKEWRVISDIYRHQHLNVINFRNSNGRFIPYIKLPMNPDTHLAPALPILAIRQGPSTTPQLNKKSLHLLLEQTGYDHVEVQGSNAPLRL